VKTTAEKLLIKPGTTVWTSHRANLGLLGPWPDGVRRVDRPDQAATAVVWADDSASLRAILDKQAPKLAAAGVLWVAYPKGNRADINRDTLWPILAERACDRCRRSRWTTYGPRFASARSPRASLPSPAAADPSARTPRHQPPSATLRHPPPIRPPRSP
jgi:hypothetical protein